MIALRSTEEIEKIRKAGKIVAITIEKLKNNAKAGVETRELDRIARDEIIKRGGHPAFKGYKGFPGNICTSLNNIVVHGIPSREKLKDGDIISLDVGVRCGDYFADGAATTAVGSISSRVRKLLEVTEKSLYKGIEKARVGNRLSDISHSVQTFVESNGYSVVRALVGHGIGTHIHEEPEVPNYGSPNRGPRLEPGMILAIEPMVNMGAFDVEILDDGWAITTKDGSLSAHFEHTIAIRDGEADILTAL